ncbi:MAG: hypothetical protein KatS3mg100_534 [Candidatus Parcubacteria bacterium]|nr:MAG: hypothetical protein KatS3mg100_534 [Candidatus Parcubacteria bacterium]
MKEGATSQDITEGGRHNEQPGQDGRDGHARRGEGQLKRAILAAAAAAPLLAGNPDTRVHAAEGDPLAQAAVSRGGADLQKDQKEFREKTALLASESAILLWVQDNNTDPRWQNWIEGGRIKEDVLRAWRMFVEKTKYFPTPLELLSLLEHLAGGGDIDSFFKQASNTSGARLAGEALKEHRDIGAFYNQRLPGHMVESAARAERVKRIAESIEEAMQKSADRGTEDPLANYIVLDNDRETLIQDLEFLFRQDFETAAQSEAEKLVLDEEDLHNFVLKIVGQWPAIKAAADKIGVAVTKRFIVEFLQAKDEGRR